MKFKLLTLMLAITLAISAASLFAVHDVFAGNINPASTCQVWEYDTTCQNSCVPSDPNGCGPGQWSYFCARKILKIYATGQYVSSPTSPAYYCNANYTCYSTCTAPLPAP